MTEIPGLYPFIIPAGVYEGQDVDIPTISMPTIMITNYKVPEEVAYSIVKILDENLEKVQNLSKALEGFNTETAWMNLPAPLHPGAERAYKELGYMK